MTLTITPPTHCFPTSVTGGTVALARWLTDAGAVVVPASCAGCGAADHAVCPGCRALLAPRPLTLTGGSLEVRASLDYGGVVARLLGALKEHGRTDVVGALAPAMRAALLAAQAHGSSSPPLLVTMPSRSAAVARRGFRPVDELVRAAGFRPANRRGRRPLLTLIRSVADQAALGATARRRNLAGSMEASPRLAGRAVLLVDDVLTTGSTLEEAARAVGRAGGRVVGAACLAHTPRRSLDARTFG